MCSDLGIINRIGIFCQEAHLGHNRKIAVIGLGYVGLPVAVAFGLKSVVAAFDINPKRVAELKRGYDATNTFADHELEEADIFWTSDKADLTHSDFFIVTVPTPLNEAHHPDLNFLSHACEIVGSKLKVGDIVVFESTVYPGATQEKCIPILEHYSKLKTGVDYTVGYSPERVNPGDKDHDFTKITKVISALDQSTLDVMAQVYGSVVEAGLYHASSIKVAEASKVIENTQRDLNIALMNELAIIFSHLNIDTQEVIDAAKTKWNFVPFYPGLVGGHCIGVAPYYLTYQSERAGYRPEVILAGRRINDGMGKYIAEQAVKKLILSGNSVRGATVGILGITFKENCTDIRNSRVIDVINELESYGVNVLVHDPLANAEEVYKEYEIELSEWKDIEDVDALILCVAHRYYKELSADEVAQKLSENGKLILDVKGILDREPLEALGLEVWRL